MKNYLDDTETAKVDVGLVDNQRRLCSLNKRKVKFLAIGILALLILIIIIIIASHANNRKTLPGYTPQNITVNTPSTIFYSTQVIKLENDLEVLLISDHQASTSGAGLVLSVGSKHEPKALPGILETPFSKE
jgi:hypothetical protein